MTEEMRRELVQAIRDDRIDNATRYAEEFAARHGLNPSTVRSSISRLRRDLGLLKRRRRRIEDLAGQTGVEGTPFRGLDIRLTEPSNVNPIRLLTLSDATDSALARLGAAVLVRYEEDQEFRRAVDGERPEIERLHERVSELRKIAEELPPDEKEELSRFLEP